MGLQSLMVNAQRCVTLTEILQERVLENDAPMLLEKRPFWPEYGNIEFKNVGLKYRPNLETVLHDLSFKVRQGEKIGVVGRTGAGKSTICLSIARIVEIF